MQVIGLHIGGSFAEASVWGHNENQARATALFYLPRHNLRTALPRFLNALPDPQISGAFVTSRYFERLFEFRLGGSTAQLVTAGFEKWPFLAAAPVRTGFTNPAKSHPISSMELTFGIDERLEADGQVRVPFSVESLIPIAEKLNLMQIKRVCVHFLHAAVNPVHEDAAAAWLREKGFDVWTPPRTPGVSEGSRWRASTLEASFSGTFEELRSEIAAGLAQHLPAESLRIHDGEGFKSFAEARKVGTLFADDVLLLKHSGPRRHLRLDLESWSELAPTDTAEWQSPWGPVACPGPKRRPLTVQPSCSLASCGPSQVGAAERSEGFEPGPLCFGRGQKLMVFDLWAEAASLRSELSEHITDTALARRDSALLALSRETKAKDASAFARRMRQDLERWLMADLAASADARDYVKTGRMSSVLEGFKGFGQEGPSTTAADRVALAGLEDMP